MYVFFFQAEDGIRDRNVTGVQTVLFRSRKWHDLQRGADLDPWFQEISVIEEAAGELRDYQPLVWPGLVQTEAYARALTHDVWPGRSPESVESLVKSRLKRQELLGRPDSPLITKIV